MPTDTIPKNLVKISPVDPGIIGKEKERELS